MLLTYEEMSEGAFEFYNDLQINIPKKYVALAVRSLTMPQYAKEYQDKYGDTIGDHTALATVGDAVCGAFLMLDRYGNAYNSSYECLMRDTTYQFCEVCKLQGSKRMSQLIDGKSLYVADPEVKKYTGQYSAYSDFVDTTYTGYYNFANYRDGVLLSGADKNKFNTSMAGETIQLRTIVQNLSDTTQRYVTMKLWIKHAYGSVATTTGGQRLEATQTFTIPVWSEKSKFWPKGALSYEGSNMNSGLENCELIYQIPLDADLKHGDYVAFEVIDESGNILANDNTETQTYANINIEYKFEDGTPMPNANKATIPVAVGSKLNWTAPSTMFGHTFVRAEGHDQMVNGSGQTVTYYYTKQSKRSYTRLGRMGDQTATERILARVGRTMLTRKRKIV